MNKEEFKSARQRKGLTQKELAAFLGVSYSAITKWETGGNPIPAWVADKLREPRRGLSLEGLAPEELAALERRSASRGVTSDQFAVELIRAFLKLGALVMIGQVFFPAA